MNIQSAESIRQLDPAELHDPQAVRAIIGQIVLLEGAGKRRLALRALVERLIAADELEEAVSAARLAPDLTPSGYVNDVDYFLKGELLLAIADRLLDQGRRDRAAQLLDEAALGLEDLGRYEVFDMPTEPPWLQLTRRYWRSGMPARIRQVWDTAVAWARSVEQSLAIPEPHFFQPEDGSRFLAGIAEDMARMGEPERAREVAAAISDHSYRSAALARVGALAGESPQG